MEEITIVELKPQTVLGMRKTGKYDLIPQMLLKVYEFTKERRIPIQGPPVFVCHEMTPEEVISEISKALEILDRNCLITEDEDSYEYRKRNK